MRRLMHLLASLILPISAAVLMPFWLLHRFSFSASAWAGGDGPEVLLLRVAGAVVFALGFALFAWCVWLFGNVGHGTLAPWDPPLRFVAVGPYRYVRNPMISGVAAMLVGEALVFSSMPLVAWAVTFIVINQVYFVLSEERYLERRFGPRYRAYKAAVPRWVPRWIPWEEQ